MHFTLIRLTNGDVRLTPLAIVPHPLLFENIYTALNSGPNAHMNYPVLASSQIQNIPTN